MLKIVRKPLIIQILFSISIVFVYKQSGVKMVLFQANQFSISTQFSSIWSRDRTLSGAITPGQSGPGSDGNERVLLIPQSPSIIGTSPSDCFMFYPGHILDTRWGGVLPLCRDAAGVFYSPSRLGKLHPGFIRNTT